MKACFDVQYSESLAWVAGVLFSEWTSETAAETQQFCVGNAGEYEPGQFYKRELNPLLSLIETIETPIHEILIDAYCILSDDGSPGLGAHLHEALDERIPVIGVAKNRFRDTSHAIPVIRGTSKRPLFVTAVGTDPKQAAKHIQKMHGENRHPTMLKLADNLARQGLREN